MGKLFIWEMYKYSDFVFNKPLACYLLVAVRPMWLCVSNAGLGLGHKQLIVMRRAARATLGGGAAGVWPAPALTRTAPAYCNRGKGVIYQSCISVRRRRWLWQRDWVLGLQARVARQGPSKKDGDVWILIRTHFKLAMTFKSSASLLEILW